MRWQTFKCSSKPNAGCTPTSRRRWLLRFACSNFASDSPAHAMSQPRDFPKNTSRLLAAGFGAFVGLCLLKFGNPPIFEKYVAQPADLYEFLLGTPWPIAWGYGLLIVVSLSSLALARRPGFLPMWLVVLPGLWLAWQFLAGFSTVDTELTKG